MHAKRTPLSSLFHTPFHFTISYLSRFTSVLDAAVHVAAAACAVWWAMGASLPKTPCVGALMSAAHEGR